MDLTESIAEVPAPPGRRLPLPLLLLKIISNPVTSWSREFYEEPFVLYRKLGFEVAFVMDPDLIESVLFSDRDKFSRSPFYEDVMGDMAGEGLLTSEGEHWRWQRRLATPLFSSDEIVAAYVPAFASACRPVLQRWSQAGVGETQTIGPDLAGATLQALQDTLLGVDLSEEDRRLTEDAAAIFLSCSGWRSIYSVLRLPRFIPHPRRSAMQRACARLRAMALQVLTRRRADGSAGDDLLLRLMAARDPATGEAMPDRLIVDNILTFLIAGHETTAQALTWTLYLLARFPDWQERVRQELRDCVNTGPISGDHLQQLTLLDAVFQEAMRLFPPAPVLMRRSRTNVRLGQLSLAAGATVVIPIYVVHRHRSLWQDPLHFDPSRFAAGSKTKRHRSAYLPFGIGPRACIGGAFAKTEGKTMLATLLAGAHFDLPEDELPVPRARITLRPKDGIRLKVTIDPDLARRSPSSQT